MLQRLYICRVGVTIDEHVQVLFDTKCRHHVMAQATYFYCLLYTTYTMYEIAGVSLVKTHLK